MKKVSIIDSGTSNLFSIKNAIRKVGIEAKITSKKGEIDKSEILVLPGVGSFKQAMDNLNKKKIIKPIKDHILSGKRFLGICLGFQLLFERSSEFGNTKGLGILKGSVEQFDKKKVKSIPHVGWNKTKEKKNLNYVKSNEFYYFVHSFYAKPKNTNIVYTTTTADNFIFCSSIINKNIFGCQFHPEKSGKQGLNFLKKFLKLNAR